MKTTVESIVNNELARLKGISIEPQTTEDGYSQCGLEDMLSEGLNKQIESITKLLSYVRGEYTPKSTEDLKELDKQLRDEVFQYFQNVMLNCNEDIGMINNIAWERLYPNPY